MKDIKDFKGLYRAYENGRIWSYPKEITITRGGIRAGKWKQKFGGKFLEPMIYSCGYAYVYLYKDGRGYRYRLHRIIAETFLERPKNKSQVNHKNGIKTDNRIENLEWCTGRENVDHAMKNGLLPKGKTHYRFGKKGTH